MITFEFTVVTFIADNLFLSLFKLCGNVTVNGELRRKPKEAEMYQHSPGGMSKTMKTVRIEGLREDNQSWGLPNVKCEY